MDLFADLCFWTFYATSFYCGCRKQVLESKMEAEKDGVVVPTTLQQYCHSSKPTALSFESQSSVDFDYYDSYSVDADDSDSDVVTVTSWPRCHGSRISRVLDL